MFLTCFALQKRLPYGKIKSKAPSPGGSVGWGYTSHQHCHRVFITCTVKDSLRPLEYLSANSMLINIRTALDCQTNLELLGNSTVSEYSFHSVVFLNTLEKIEYVADHG